MIPVLLIVVATGSAQVQQGSAASSPGLPDAPQAQNEKPSPMALYLPARDRYARIVPPGTRPRVLLGGEKLVYSVRESTRPLVLVPALYSASYEQLVGSDPKYGSDSAAYGEKFGAAMVRSTATRLLGDGVYAAAFHQDPRYYRIGEGPIVKRGLRSAEQALVRRGDDGRPQVNYSGLLGRASSAALTLAYYPAPSANGGIVLSTFAVSILGDAGGNLLLEFLPDATRRFRFLRWVPIS